MSIFKGIVYEINQTIMLSKSCICRIKWKHWKEKTGNYIFKKKTTFQGENKDNNKILTGKFRRRK